MKEGNHEKKDSDLNATGTTDQEIENTVSHILFELAKPYSEQDLKRTDMLLEL